MVCTQQCKEFTKITNLQEVEVTVTGIIRNSTRGPDEMIGAFHQDAWDIIGEDVYNIVVTLFCGFELSRFITHTKLVMSPKILLVNTFSDMSQI